MTDSACFLNTRTLARVLQSLKKTASLSYGNETSVVLISGL